MKIGIFANTTAQMYFYKNIINCLEKDGHEFLLLARDYREIKEVAHELGLMPEFFLEPRRPHWRKSPVFLWTP